jgi:hypothetical protein
VSRTRRHGNVRFTFCFGNSSFMAHIVAQTFRRPQTEVYSTFERP